MSDNYIDIDFTNEKFNKNDNGFENRMLPFARSDVLLADLIIKEELTDRKVFRIGFRKPTDDIDFLPGDTLGILAPNDADCVEKLLIRLNLEKVADVECKLKILANTKKRNPTIPKHLPKKSSIREIFMHHVDIESVPKKIFLKSLIKYTHDENELKHLETISSPTAKDEYTKFIREKGNNLLGILNSFPSCQPPVALLFEHLPALLPRPYSISSSPQEENIEITFVVVEKESGRKGLCSGWLEKILPLDKIPYYFRQSTKFRLPEDSTKPLILICAGTGIAPFRGFLKHRYLSNLDNSTIWLFYGCRNSNEFLYKDEIEKFHNLKILTKLDVAYSREGPSCYVQDLIKKNMQEFYLWIMEKNADIFICGDHKSLVKDVEETIVNIFVEIDDISIVEAKNKLSLLIKNNRYVIDNWI